MSLRRNQGSDNPRSKEWADRYELEDLIALVLDIDDLREAVKQVAWATGDGRLMALSEKQKDKIERLHKRLRKKRIEMDKE